MTDEQVNKLVQALNDIKNQLFWIYLILALCGGFIIGYILRS